MILAFAYSGRRNLTDFFEKKRHVILLFHAAFSLEIPLPFFLSQFTKVRQQAPKWKMSKVYLGTYFLYSWLKSHRSATFRFNALLTGFICKIIIHTIVHYIQKYVVEQNGFYYSNKAFYALQNCTYILCIADKEQ